MDCFLLGGWHKQPADFTTKARVYVDLPRYIGMFAYTCVLVGTSIIISKYIPIYDDFVVFEKHIFPYLLLIILFPIFSLLLLMLIYFFYFYLCYLLIYLNFTLYELGVSFPKLLTPYPICLLCYKLSQVACF